NSKKMRPHSLRKTDSQAKIMRKPQRSPALCKVPPPEEENPRIKCKECGAFGHRASSRRCPIRKCPGALCPQPVFPNRGKENLEPRQPQVLKNPEPGQQSEREKEQKPREEQQQSPPLPRVFPRSSPGWKPQNRKESSESRDPLRTLTRPMPVNPRKKGPVLDPVRSIQPPVKCDLTFTSCSVSPMKMQALNSLSSNAASQKQAVALSDTHRPALKHRGHEALYLEKRAHGWTDNCVPAVPQAASKPRGLGHVLNPWEQAKCPEVISQAGPPPATQSLGQNVNFSIRAPGKRSGQNPICTGPCLQKKPRLSPFQTPQKSTQRPELHPLGTAQPVTSATGFEAKVSPQLTKKTSAQVPSIDVQLSHHPPILSFLQACTEPTVLSPSYVPAPPLRMVFKRLDNGWWSSGLLMAPSSSPPEKPGPPAQDQSVLEKSEVQCTQGPLSVLYEDLQLSSSSEDGDTD
uniref:Zinc knuckle domain-containing protein n=1 Tax=Otolemur garnettii TaxID=30611 RepID=H0XR54_OTOGA